MADMYAVPGETLTGIADAIRSKTGSDEMMTVAAMASAIEGISGGAIQLDNGEFSDAGSYSDPFDYKISHKLGKIPKLVAVWTESDEAVTAGTKSVGGFFARFGNYFSGDGNYEPYLCYVVYKQVDARFTRTVANTNTIKNLIIPNITSDSIIMPCMNQYVPYIDGATYKWVAAYWE